MGFTYIKARVYSIDLARWGMWSLVDSEALFTSIPRFILERLGLKPITSGGLEFMVGE
jgi:hypothetical protein